MVVNSPAQFGAVSKLTFFARLLPHPIKSERVVIFAPFKGWISGGFDSPEATPGERLLAQLSRDYVSENGVAAAPTEPARTCTVQTFAALSHASK